MRMESRFDKHVPIETEQVYRNVDGTVAVERITREPPVEERADRPARRPSLAGLLVGAGLTSYEQITEALEEGLGTGERLGEVIVRRGWATEEDLAQLLAEQWSLPYLSGAHINADPAAVEQLPLPRARELGALPVFYDESALVVAVAEPAEDRFAKVREALDGVSFAVVGRSVLERLLANGVPRLAETLDTPAPAEPGSLTQRLADLLREVEELESRLRRTETHLESAYERQERDEEMIAQLEKELGLRENLVEVLQAKLTDL
jgi:hypothetical protein